MKNSKKKIYMHAGSSSGDRFLSATPKSERSDQVWRWGSDNLLPIALVRLSQSSAIHRRILNDKSDFIAGRGFGVDSENLELARWVSSVNGEGESLRNLLQRVSFDRLLFGNAFIEIVTNPRGDFLSLFHQDASRCRVSRDRNTVVLHHDWTKFRQAESKELPLYPEFREMKDGTSRSLLHYKDYEPMTFNYGIPKYIAALGAASIAYKTDRWNVSRLESAFQPSGIMVLDGEVDSEIEAAEIARMAERKFAGRAGQVMFMVKNSIEGDHTKFIPIETRSDGDWQGLHEQATQDIMVAHSWFRTLSGLEYSSGFSADRITYEYSIALNTIIEVEQQELIEPIIRIVEQIMGIDCSSLTFVNRPPFEAKPAYMKVWEARRADGLEYNSDDLEQQRFLAEL